MPSHLYLSVWSYCPATWHFISTCLILVPSNMTSHLYLSVWSYCLTTCHLISTCLILLSGNMPSHLYLSVWSYCRATCHPIATCLSDPTAWQHAIPSLLVCLILLPGNMTSHLYMSDLKAFWGRDALHLSTRRGLDSHIWHLSLQGQWSWNNSFILVMGVGTNTEMYNWNVMGDRAHSYKIYCSFPPQTLYILVLIFVQDYLTDMNSK